MGTASTHADPKEVHLEPTIAKAMLLLLFIIRLRFYLKLK